jgi:hypothetical protein
MFQTQCRRCIAVAALLGTGLGLMAEGAAGAAPSANDCTTTVSGSQAGSLTVSSPATGAVPAGSSVDVLATWTAPDWTEKATLLMCTTTNGVFAAPSSASLPVVPQDGSYTSALAVPADVPVGSDVCVRDVLVGHQSDGTEASQTSNQLCFRTAAVSSPTTSITVTTATTVTTAAPAVVTTPPTTDSPAVTAGGPAEPAVPQAAPPAVAVAPAPLSRPDLPRTGAPVELLAGVGSGATVLGRILRVRGSRRGR